MPILYDLLFKLKRRKVERKTVAICDHMLYIYNYFAKVRTLEPQSSFIKEALGFLEDWQQISENIYKFKPTGETIEIKKIAKIDQVTKKVIQIEIPWLVKSRSQLVCRLLTEHAWDRIDEYFRLNKVYGKA